MRALEVVRAVRGDQREPLGGGGADEEAQEVPRRAVRPVKILDHEYDRPPAAEPPERSAEELEQPLPPNRRGSGGRRCVLGGEIRHDAPDLRPTLPERVIELVIVDLRGERAQGTGDRRIRELSGPDVDAAAEQDKRSVVSRGAEQLLDQPALADARVPGHDCGRSLARRSALDHCPQCRQFRRARDQRRRRSPHRHAPMIPSAPGLGNRQAPGRARAGASQPRAAPRSVPLLASDVEHRLAAGDPGMGRESVLARVAEVTVLLPRLWISMSSPSPPSSPRWRSSGDQCS